MNGYESIKSSPEFTGNPQLHIYAVNFWNPATDEELSVWVEDYSWFSAEEILGDIRLSGFQRGTHFYVDQNSYIVNPRHITEVNFSPRAKEEQC